MTELVIRVARQFRERVGHSVRILIDRDATNAIRKRAEHGIVGTFETSAALYRIFDGEELRRIVKSGKITGGVYAVGIEREHGASWGSNISEVISWGNHQRGKRLGDDLFLAKLDTLDKRFFHMHAKEILFDPNGPAEQPATMDMSLCSTGLGCSMGNTTIADVTFYSISPEGQMTAVSDANLHDYLAGKPQQDIELRQVSQIYYSGSLHGVDVIVRKNQEHIKNQYGIRDQGPYYGTWQVENRDSAPVVMGAKSFDVAVERAEKMLREGPHHGPALDLLQRQKTRRAPSYGR